MTKYQKVVYEGRLSSYQKYGTSFNKVQFEKDPFNSYQNFLYKRALFGLSVYQKEELEKMHWDKKRRIEKVHERAQKVLNLWKQEMTNQWLGTILSTVFHHSSFVKELNEKFGSETDEQYISKVDFKSLGVSKQQVVEKLIQEKILPANFYQLTGE
jgi:hypothetical protein